MMWLQRSKRSDAAAQKTIVILSLVSDPPKGYSFGGFRYAGSIPIVRNMLFHTQFLTSRNLICHSAFQPVMSFFLAISQIYAIIMSRLTLHINIIYLQLNFCDLLFLAERISQTTLPPNIGQRILAA